MKYMIVSIWLLGVSFLPVAYGETEGAPDLVGTWNVEYEGMRHQHLGESNFGDGASHSKVPSGIFKSSSDNINMVLIIQKQEGDLFLGTLKSDNYRQAVSGVIGFADGENIPVSYVTNMGMTHLQLVSPNKMQGVTLVMSKHDSMAIRVTLTRDKEQ